ncbi:MAG: T9SS type A sorting domain-containing protein [Candidatus Pacebacteria bacterium]|nr:T9SS type A sorting domain-containing protein [Candidatus Paceibacterota bacterium]
MFTRLFHAAIVSVILIAATSCHETAKAQTVNDSLYYKLYDHYGRYVTKITDTVVRTMRCRVQTSTNSSFTAGLVYTNWDTISTVIGTLIKVDTPYGIDSNGSYARVIWDTLSGSTQYTAGQIIELPHTITVTTTRTSLKIFTTVTIFGGHRKFIVTGRLGFNSTFTVSSPLGVDTITSLMPVVVHDTTDTLTSGTHYWLDYTGVGGFFPSVVVISPDSTLPVLPNPTAHDSAITVGSTNYVRRISCNTYGVAGGYAKAYLHDSATLALIDTQRVWLTGTGVQSPIFTHTGLTPVHGYISKINVHDTAGDVWLVDTFRTTAIPIVPVTVDSIWYFKTSGPNGIVTFRMTDTAAVTLRYRLEVNDSMFTGTPHYSTWDTVTVTGHMTQSVTVTGSDTNVNWVKIYTNTIGSTTTNVTPAAMMYRASSLTCTINAATTALYPDVTIRTSNGLTTLRGELGFDSAFVSHAPLDTIVLTTHAPSVLFRDTVGYTLSAYTVYWVRYFVTDTFGTRVYTFRDTTLPIVALPYIADAGPAIIGSTTATRNIKLDVYGSTGSYYEFFVDSAGVRVDSQHYAVPALVGIQTFSPTTIHRAPAHTYTWNVKVHNSIGNNWATTTTFTTDPAISTLGLHNDTVKLIGHSGIHYVVGYTNVPSDMCDISQHVFKVGSSVPVSITTAGLTASLGQVTNDYTGLGIGTYWVYSYAHNYTGDIAYSDTSVIVIAPPTIVTLSANPGTTVGSGDTVIFSINVHDADSVTFTNNVSSTTVAVSDSGTFSWVADTTTKFTLTAFGVTTVTGDITITVTPHDTTDTVTSVYVVALEKEKVVVYPNPVVNEVSVIGATHSTIMVTDMVGHVLYNFVATDKIQKINVANIPNGQYLLSIRNENNSTENFRFVIQR